MITCRQLVELLIDFADDRLSAEQRECVEYHLTFCSSCVAYVESYHCTVQLTRQLPCVPLPIGLQALLQTILEETGREQGTQPREENQQPGSLPPSDPQ